MESMDDNCKNNNFLNTDDKSGLRKYLLEYLDLTKLAKLITVNKICNKDVSVKTLKKLLQISLEKLKNIENKKFENLLNYELSDIRKLILNLNLRKEIENIFKPEDEIRDDLRRKGIKNSNLNKLVKEEKIKDEQQKVDLYVKHLFQFLISIILSGIKKEEIPYETFHKVFKPYLFEQSSKRSTLVGKTKVFYFNEHKLKADSDFFKKLAEVYQDEETLLDKCSYDTSSASRIYSKKTEDLIKQKFPYKIMKKENLEISLTKNSPQHEFDLIRNYLEKCFENINLNIENKNIKIDGGKILDMFILPDEEEGPIKLLNFSNCNDYSKYFLNLIHKIKFKQTEIKFGKNVTYSEKKMFDIFSTLVTDELFFNNFSMSLKSQEKIFDSISKNENISQLTLRGDRNQCRYSGRELKKEGFIEAVQFDNIEKETIKMAFNKLNLNKVKDLIITKCIIDLNILGSIFKLPLEDLFIQKVKVNENIQALLNTKPNHNLTNIVLENFIMSENNLELLMEYLTYKPENIKLLNIVYEDLVSNSKWAMNSFLTCLKVVLENIIPDKFTIQTGQDVETEISYTVDQTTNEKILNISTLIFTEEFEDLMRNQPNRKVAIDLLGLEDQLEEVLSFFEESETVEEIEINYYSGELDEDHLTEEEKQKIIVKCQNMINPICYNFKEMNSKVKFIINIE